MGVRGAAIIGGRQISGATLTSSDGNTARVKRIRDGKPGISIQEADSKAPVVSARGRRGRRPRQISLAVRCPSPWRGAMLRVPARPSAKSRVQLPAGPVEENVADVLNLQRAQDLLDVMGLGFPS